MAVDIDYEKKKKQIEQASTIWEGTTNVKDTLEDICEYMDDTFERERLIEVIVEVEKLETQAGKLRESLLDEMPRKRKKTHLRIVKED